MMSRKVWQTTKFIIRKIFYKPYFWTVFFWPLVIVIFLCACVESSDIKLIFNRNIYEYKTLIAVYVLIFMSGFVQIIAREFFCGKNERVIQFIISMSGVKIQFWGRFIAMLMMIGGINIIYMIFILMNIKSNVTLAVLVNSLKVNSFYETICLVCGVAILFIGSILGSMYVGINSSEVSKIGQKQFLIYLFLFINWLISFNSNKTIARMIYFIPYLNINNLTLEKPNNINNLEIFLLDGIYTIIILSYLIHLYQQKIAQF